MYIRNPSVNRNLSRLMWKWYLHANSDGSGKPACASTQSRQSLHCSLTQYMEPEEASDKEPVIGCTCEFERSHNAIMSHDMTKFAKAVWHSFRSLCFCRKKKKKNTHTHIFGTTPKYFWGAGEQLYYLYGFGEREQNNFREQRKIFSGSPVLFSGSKWVLISHGGLCLATKPLDCNSLMIQDQDQDRDSLLVKRRNDNHSLGPVIRELVPSSHQRSELSNTILCIFSRWDQRIGEGIPIPDSLGKEATFINVLY